MFILVVVLSFIASSLVRMWMKRTYARWHAVPNTLGANGHAVARHILDSNGLQQVRLEVSAGQLSDHYIPSQKLMRLSQGINNDATVAAIAVAAHECGHAIQDLQGYAPLRFKAVMMPLAAVGNQIGLLLTVGGGFMGSDLLLNAGLLLMLSGVLMPLLTLPIEFDASKRALEQLTALKLVDARDRAGAKSMLTAAALTYVASAASSMALLAVFLFRFVRR